MTLRETIQLLAEGIKDISTDRKLYKYVDLETFETYLKRGFIIKDSGYGDSPRSLIGTRDASRNGGYLEGRAIQIELFADRIKAGVRGAKIKPINPDGSLQYKLARMTRREEKELKQDYNINPNEVKGDTREWLAKNFPEKSQDWRETAREKLVAYWTNIEAYKKELQDFKGSEVIFTSDFDRLPLDPKFVRFVIMPYTARIVELKYDSYERARNIDGWKAWKNNLKKLILKHKDLFKQDENFNKLLGKIS